MSFGGGLCSIIVMIILLSLKKRQISYIIISIFSAVAHNFGQLVISWFLLKTTSVFYYAPILIISGVFMGVITGIVLKVMIPAMDRLNGSRTNLNDVKKI